MIEVAAAGVPPPPEAVDLTSWVAGLPAEERDALLVGLLKGDDPLLRAETLRRTRTGPGDGPGVRTAGDILGRAADRRDERLRVERERRATRAREAARRAEEARQRRLTALAAEGDAAWGRVADHVAAKKPSDYEVAVTLLVDLQK